MNYSKNILVFFIGTLAGLIFFKATHAQVVLGNNPIGTAIITATSNGSNIPVHRFSLTVPGGGATLSGVNFNTTGDYLASDIRKFKLYYSASASSFSTSNLLATNNTPSAAGIQSFPGFSQNLAAGTYYIWITADLSRTATNGRTLQVDATGTGNITVSIAKSGSGAQSGIQKFGRTQDYQTPGTYLWKAPSCVTEIEVETWGGGGGGGANGNTTNDGGCAGGGGGAYSKSFLTVTPGVTYTIIVGAGGNRGTQGVGSGTNGQDGGISAFIGPGGDLTRAAGGKGATLRTINGNAGIWPGAQGGAAADGVGNIKYNGGKGGDGNNTGSWGQGGGGGSSAGIASEGLNGINGDYNNCNCNGLGVTPPTGGGKGGDGGTGRGDGNDAVGPGLAGSLPGGGGGGGGGIEGNAGQQAAPPNLGVPGSIRNGGNGGDGQVKISWRRYKQFDANGLWTWTPPPGITTVTVTVWGAGGGGAGARGAGGGGGAMSQSILNVVPGNTYSLYVGRGGNAGAGSAPVNGGNGEDSWFWNNTTVFAKGGTGATNHNTVGTGGSSALGVGSNVRSGGNGGTTSSSNNWRGGGGGGSASPTALGNTGINGNNDGTGGEGGAAHAFGGAGGRGGYNSNNDNNNGETGNSPGGGGGGAGRSEIAGDALGGKGANGRVVIDYESENPAIGDNPISAANICPQTKNVVFHSFSITEIPVCDESVLAEVSDINFTTSGTYQASDVLNFKLYYTTTKSFSTTNLLSTLNSPGVAGLKNMPAFSSPLRLISNTPIYFWITMDVSSTAGGGRTIQGGSIDGSHVTSSVAPVFSADASSAMIFADVRLASTSTTPICNEFNNFSFTPSCTADAGATFAWSRATVAGISESGTSGTGSVTETLTNTTAASINVTYTFTTTALGCTNMGENIVVSVKPSPTMTTTTAKTICSGENVNITLGANITSGFTWLAANNASVTGESTSAQNTTTINNNLINTSNISQVVSYTVSPTSNPGGCVGAKQVVNVRVNPTPTLSSSLNPSTICSGTAFTYTPSGTVSGTNFTWARNTNTNINEVVTTGNGNIGETLTNKSSSNVSVGYTYTLSANNCINTQTVTTLVRPAPQGSFTGNSRCGSDIASLGRLTWTATAGTGPFALEYLPGTKNNVTSGVSYSLTAGTPTADSTYVLTKVRDNFGCERTSGFTAGTATITVQGSPIAVLPTTPENTTTCAGTTTSFSVSATNVNTYSWAVSVDNGNNWTTITAPGVSPKYENFTTATLKVTNATVDHRGYLYKAILAPACGPITESKTAKLTVDTIPVLTSGKGFANTICSGALVTYTPSSNVSSSGFSWTRATVAGITQPGKSDNGNVSEILTNTTTSPINVTYNFVTTSKGCSNTGEDVIITINPDASIVLSSAVNTNNQRVCLDDKITNIVYTFNEGATGATATGLPTNLTTSISGKTFTIKDFAKQEGVFNYTVNTTGPCKQTSTIGKITVGLSLVSPPNTTDQYVCKNSPITNILYAVGSQSATAVGLPPGVTTSFNAGIFTISGTPNKEGYYTYTVNTVGACTKSTFKTGTITVGVGALDTSLISQEICKNDFLQPIVFNVVGGGNPIASVKGLEGSGLAGVITNTLNPGTFTISGKGTKEGTYVYTVSTASNGACATISSITGTITIGVGAADTSLINQEICKNDFIQPIVFNVVGGGNPIAKITGLEGSGLSGSVTNSGNPGKFTISGKGTKAGTYVYTVSTATNGVCTTISSITGTITIGVGAADSSLISQEICKDDFIQPIVFNVVGGGNPIAKVTGLEGSGLSGSVTNSGNPGKFTISGKGTKAGTYVYTVSTATNGVCTTISSITGTITIGVGAVDSSLISQEICRDDFIQPIVFNVVGGGNPIATVTGLEDSGLSGNVTNSSDPGTFTISGKGTKPGTYVYTVSTATNGVCTTISSITGTITIGVGAADSSLISQEICKDDFIQPIVFNVVGGGNPIAKVTGLEGSGLSGSVTNSGNPGKFTISGKGTKAGTYVYTVSTATNGVCTTISFITGTITIGVGAVDTSLINQEICKDDFIKPIVFNIIGGGNPIATVTGLEDSGLSGNVTNSSDPGTFTISGKGTKPGTYVYTVSTATNGVCTTISSITGTIIIGIGNSIINNSDQTLCVKTPLSPITFPLPGFVTGVTPEGLPAGVNGIISGKNYIISGTPTVPGTYDYTVTAISTCASPSQMTGKLIVNADTINLSSGNFSQILCLNEALAPISFSLSGTANSAILSGNSLSGNLSGKVFTISGTPPAVSGVYNYSVTTIGTCSLGTSSRQFSVRVVQPIAAFDVNQTESIVPMTVDFTNNSNSDATVYNWIFGDGNTSNNLNTTNIYLNAELYTPQLIVSYNGQCPDTASLKIKAIDLVIPNIFTPNGDFINDVYRLNPTGLDGISMEIYNRWGNLVFKSNSLGEGWDGTDKFTNVECSSGTYYYVIELLDKTRSNKRLEKGYIQLVR